MPLYVLLHRHLWGNRFFLFLFLAVKTRRILKEENHSVFFRLSLYTAYQSCFPSKEQSAVEPEE